MDMDDPIEGYYVAGPKTTLFYCGADIKAANLLRSAIVLIDGCDQDDVTVTQVQGELRFYPAAHVHSIDLNKITKELTEVEEVPVGTHIFRSDFGTKLTELKKEPWDPLTKFRIELYYIEGLSKAILDGKLCFWYNGSKGIQDYYWALTSPATPEELPEGKCWNIVEPSQFLASLFKVDAVPTTKDNGILHMHFLYDDVRVWIAPSVSRYGWL